MGVYIKGMEMPKSCGECAIKSWDGEDDVCPFSGISALSIGRQDDCPLVPVSPHGRLIDADALIRGLTLGDEDDNNGASLLMAIFLEVLKAAPTIIPAEPCKEKGE